jgi:chloramphenicol O-acetyltransferase type B
MGKSFMTVPPQPPTGASILRRGYRALKQQVARRLTHLLAEQPEWKETVHSWVTQEADRPVSDARVRVGPHTYGVFARTVFMARDEDRLDIGKFCGIAPGVRFIFGNHPLEKVTTYPLRTILCEKWLNNVDAVSRGPIVVGNDVWIASESIVLSGVTIGDGAVIGAGSIVTRDVAPYALAAGVPARHIRYRFEEHQIARLLQIRWWDWPEETIRENIDAFYGDVESFITRFAAAEQA